MTRLVFMIAVLGITDCLSQSVKFNGIYESEAVDSTSTYIRFYADGIVLVASSHSNSIDLVKRWLTYENKGRYGNGFFVVEANGSILMTTYEPLMGMQYLRKGTVSKDSFRISLTEYYYRDGMVKSFRESYAFKPLN